MKPVNVSAFGTVGDLAAAAKIAFGAAVMRSASGTLKATADIVHNIIGITDWDLVEKTEDGFYSQYDIVPLIASGIVRLWVTSNEDTKEDIQAGDYLEIADVGGSNALPVGAFQQMNAQSGTCTGAVREVSSLARALEDVTLTDIEPASVDLAIGGTTVTLLAADITSLGLAADDYILLEDISGQCMINRVKSVTSTVITLQMASTVALTSGDSDPIHKLHQVEALLI